MLKVYHHKKQFTNFGLKSIMMILFFLLTILYSFKAIAIASDTDTTRRKEFLRQIISVLPPENPKKESVSHLDKTWLDWLHRTGELPPDFDRMPSNAQLPEPLILGDGSEVKTLEQWQKKKEWIKKELQHWITGTFPPPPENIQVKIIKEEKKHDVITQYNELSFGPDNKALMHIELLIPEGDGPFPVFLTQSNHRSWAMIAVRRGYIGCLYAANDGNDDTETYQHIWYPEYDFTQLMRRAWGAHRVVDYLYTLDVVDKEKIGITGHSRNGKQVLFAAAYDERISAVIPSSGNTGEANPWRYASEEYNVETIVQITTNFPNWIHPRIRFFVGREHKLPIDQNLMLALVAPRGLMLSSAITEPDCNPLGLSESYKSVKKVYSFLEVMDNLVINLRDGNHSVNARDVETFCDFFDYVFDRSEIKPSEIIYNDYSFENWLQLSTKNIDLTEYPIKNINDLLINESSETIESVPEWEEKKINVKDKIKWGLGNKPGFIEDSTPVAISQKQDFLRNVIGNPDYDEDIVSATINVGFGDSLEGSLFYSNYIEDKTENKKPVVIFLHDYAYSSGFKLQPRRQNEIAFIRQCIEKGFAVFQFDQIGFGTRVEEGGKFYLRYPDWSKMGKMIADTRAAVDAMSNLNIIDKNRIYIMGYSLGATVALFASALDDRIAGTISVAGFTPMRLDCRKKGTEGIWAYSHLHGLMPRLGFFLNNENRIPFDFHEILACTAPRPLLIIAPKWDRDATCEEVLKCFNEVETVYALYDSQQNSEIFSPDDYDRFSLGMQKRVLVWLEKNLLNIKEF